jgi:hypothetical protein
MKWSDVDISFGPEDHPETERSDQNLPFVVKLPIGRHKVDKTLIDNGAWLNLIMRKTFIAMCHNRSDLTLVHDTFHGVILGQSSTPIGRIDLEISCGTGDNKCREILTFKVASFGIGYSCILGRSLLMKFMVVIHTAYATMKMPGPKGVTTIRADQWDTLACENATLSHAGRFGEKAAQEQSANVAKMQGGSTLLRSLMPKPPIAGTPRTPLAKKGIYAALPSTQHPANQSTDDKKKGGQTQGDPSWPQQPGQEAPNEYKSSSQIGTRAHHFSIRQSICLRMADIQHKLSIDPSYKPVKQKERRYTLERRKTIWQEVNKLLEAGFIRPIDYLNWLENPVLVEKPDGYWRMCIDYTSLNNACPKDEYPLLHIC